MIQLESGFVARLIASEPLVIDPVEVAFDDAGNMWVVEMRDYPLRLGDVAAGKIKVLSDTTGDGIYDHATVFADQLEMPNGLAIWDDGVVVTLAGELVFFRDTDGDGVADDRQQWLRGFAEENEQLRANHPRNGPDGWLYVACGLRGGTVQLGSHFRGQFNGQFNGQSAQTLKIGSRDIRFDPATGRVEPVTGPAQFGLSFDRLGSRFFCSNRNPAVQVVFEQDDLTGNPLAGLVPSTVDVLPAGVDSTVFPLVNAWTTSNLHAGQFTAACGVYLRNTAGYEEVFACEPTGSLVKRVELRRSRFSLQPNSKTPPQREWLASRDPWFRPVNVTVAPNGQIVIVDMHRAVIEHPRWVPDELKNRPDERWGNSTGRVYQVVTGDHSMLSDVIRDLRRSPLKSRDSAGLVNLLKSKNQWLRTMASQILLQRGDLEILPLLIDRASDRSADESARIALLRLAVNLNGGTTEDFAVLLQTEESESFLVSALRMVRSYGSDDPEIGIQLSKLLTRGGPVQFEALLCLASFGPEDVPAELLASIASSRDPYLMVAAGSAFRESPTALLVAWLHALGELDEELVDHDSFVVQTAERLTKAAVSNSENQSVLTRKIVAFLEARTSDVGRLAGLAAISTLLAHSDVGAAVVGPDSVVWHQARAIAPDAQQPILLRRAAVAVLGRSLESADHTLLGQLARRGALPELADAFLSAWAETNDAGCNDYLITLLSQGSPRQKRTAVTLIVHSDDRLALVAKALEEGRLTPRLIGAAELRQLQQRAKGATKELFASSLNGLVDSNRVQVVQDYKSALAINGDALRGQAIFSKQCAACHKIGTVGVDVGPDISDSRTKKPIELLTSILNPNLAIDSNYFRFIAVTDDDQVLEGIIVEETADAIVMRGQDNKRSVLLRDNIQQLKATGVSLMPDGLESQIDHAAMADLISFIKGWRYMDGSIPVE